MDRLIYTAVSGMNASMVRQRMIASNMANAQTIGFRAEVMEATAVTLDSRDDNGSSLEVRSMNRTEVRGAQMRDGTITQTGRTLDVALQGRTMLAVQAADGSEAYTRRGDLSVAPSGLLQNGEGFAVMGQSGPVTVPPGAVISIAPDGAVLAASPETPDQPPLEVARLKLVSFAGTRIEKDLTGLFKVPGDGALPADPDARIIPGALEQSNVKPAEVLVEMIEAQRLFDMRTKLVATAHDLDEAGASLMRLNT